MSSFLIICTFYNIIKNGLPFCKQGHSSQPSSKWATFHCYHNLWVGVLLFVNPILYVTKPKAQSCWVIYLRPHSLWAAEWRLATSLPWELPSYWLAPLPSSEVAQEMTSPALRWKNIDSLFDWWGKLFCSPGFLAATFLAWGPKLMTVT